MKNIFFKTKNEEMNKKKRKNEKIKSKRKDKKREKKKVGKKGKEGPGGYHLPPEMGPEIDFSHKNCQEKS